MTEQQPLRFVQVGVGVWGRTWAEALHAAPGCALVAVADPAPGAAAWVADAFGGSVPSFPSLDDALAGIACDAVLVATPPETHRAVAAAALAAGRHVLLEKPLATTMADARAIAAAAAEADRVAMVSQNYRWRQPARAVQDALAANRIGALLAVRIAFRHDHRRWLADNFRAHLRHPLLQDMTIHHVDVLRAITGQNVADVVAREWRVPVGTATHDPALAALMTLDGGTQVVYEGDWTTMEDATSWNAAWELLGERGRIRWTGGVNDPAAGDVTLELWGEPSQPLEQPSLPASDRLGVLAAFRAAIATGQPPETSAADNLHSLAAILACLESLETGQVVEVADR